MTFLFIGLDGMDYELVKRFGVIQENEDIPFSLNHLDQNLRDWTENVDDFDDALGHWTFYVWPAIASGQLETPVQSQEHPLPSEVEHPLTWKYIKKCPRTLVKWVKNRVRRRPRYKSYAWDEFDHVKVIDYPLSLPEYCEGAELVKDEAMSRDYGPFELDLLRAEINTALAQDYDAIFVVTRFIDTTKHGATQPGNYGAEDMDAWFQDMLGRDFEQYHEDGMDADRFLEEDGELDVSESQREDKLTVAEKVLAHVGEAYRDVEEFLEGLMWSEVDDYVVVSDHGFQKLGMGSVNAHSRDAVLATSLGRWGRMNDFISEWRQALRERVKTWDEKDTYEDRSQKEKVEERLRDLGYM